MPVRNRFQKNATSDGHIPPQTLEQTEQRCHVDLEASGLWCSIVMVPESCVMRMSRAYEEERGTDIQIDGPISKIPNRVH